MRKILLTLAAIAFLAMPSYVLALDDCDVHESLLCYGLAEWFDLEEASNDSRLGSKVETFLLEGDNMNVARSVEEAVGTYSADFTGSNYLEIERFGFVNGGEWTIAFWVYSDVEPAVDMHVLSGDWFVTGAPTEDRWALYIDGDTAGDPIRFTTYDTEGTQIVATHAQDFAATTWYLVVVAHSPYGPYGRSELKISINGGAYTDTATAFNLHGSTRNLKVGYLLNGKIDGLGFWRRVLTDHDIDELYNGASGNPEYYPFDESR
jgi:hypothetical protein